MKNPLKLLKDLFNRPPTISPQSILKPKGVSLEDIEWLKRVGATQSEISDELSKSIQINFERHVMYKEIDRCLLNEIIASAVELYTDYSTNYNKVQASTVWVTGESKYVNVLTKFLDDIGIEEKIFDWTWTTAAYGDFFVGVEGEPGVGVLAVNDDDHPANISRIDYRNALIGFYRTPFESNAGGSLGGTEAVKLESPWDYVHFRILASKRKRPGYGDQNYSEFKTTTLMVGTETRQVSSKYGSSLLINAIPVYKRYRLADDSLLMARLTRGILKYVYMIPMGDMSNPDASAEIMKQYMNILKRARALDTSSSPFYDNKSDNLSSMEDLFIPVFGEDANHIKVEKIGGETDIRYIVDIEELRNRLASALRCPLSLLGGYVQESSGQLGDQAIEKLDIRFARNARRLQRAMIEGITRLCQIHLAYLNYDPDPELFQINMSETSSAEEMEITENLGKSTDVVKSYMEMLKNTGENWDYVRLVNYFNEKMLKLNDLDLEEYHKKGFVANPEQAEGPTGGMGGGAMPEPTEADFNTPEGEETLEEPEIEPTEQPEGEEPEVTLAEPGEAEFVEATKELERHKFIKLNENKHRKVVNMDLLASLPLPEDKRKHRAQVIWESKYKGKEIKVKKVKRIKSIREKRGNKSEEQMAEEQVNDS